MATSSHSNAAATAGPKEASSLILTRWRATVTGEKPIEPPAVEPRKRRANGTFLVQQQNLISAATSVPTSNVPVATATTDEQKKAKDLYLTLEKLGVPLGEDRVGKDCRNKVMYELQKYNGLYKNMKHEIIAPNKRVLRFVRLPGKLTVGAKRYKLFKDDNDGQDNDDAVPERGRQFLDTCRRTGFMDDLIWSLAESYCDGDEDEVTELMVYYFAKRHPSPYVKHVDLAKEEKVKEDKKNRRKRDPPPPGFQYFDGTPEMDWNIRYMELVDYKRQHGHCNVPTKHTTLGRWVSSQRTNYKHKAPSLLAKRISLLNQLGFVWQLAPYKDSFGPLGSPKFNRAMLARLTWPQLSIRQSLVMGGYDEDGLDEVVDEKHTWRTFYVTLKDRMNRRIKDFDTSDSASKAEVIRLMGILNEKGVASVFEETAGLLPGYLELAELEQQMDVEEMMSLQQKKVTATSNYETDGQRYWKKKSSNGRYVAGVHGLALHFDEQLLCRLYLSTQTVDASVHDVDVSGSCLSIAFHAHAHRFVT